MADGRRTSLTQCPQCGLAFPARARSAGEERLVSAVDGDIVELTRTFFAVCPDCGPVVMSMDGNHSTLSKSALQRLFSGRRVSRIRAQLTESEGHYFHACHHGHRIAKPEDLARWAAMSCHSWVA